MQCMTILKISLKSPSFADNSFRVEEGVLHFFDVTLADTEVMVEEIFPLLSPPLGWLENITDKQTERSQKTIPFSKYWPFLVE